VVLVLVGRGDAVLQDRVQVGLDVVGVELLLVVLLGVVGALLGRWSRCLGRVRFRLCGGGVVVVELVGRSEVVVVFLVDQILFECIRIDGVGVDLYVDVFVDGVRVEIFVEVVVCH